jgi:hypothetical protein
VFESFGEQLDFNQIVTAQVLRRFARQCNWEGDDGHAHPSSRRDIDGDCRQTMR